MYKIYKLITNHLLADIPVVLYYLYAQMFNVHIL